MALQISDEEKKFTEVYENYIKLKNNFDDKKFWNDTEIYKGKEKIKYDEFDEIKKIIIKQIICKTCKNSLDKTIEEIEKENKNFKELLVKLKDASVYLEKMGKKLKIDLYELKPDWFTDLDKEVFLEIKK
jgi:hypothetical protein